MNLATLLRHLRPTSTQLAVLERSLVPLHGPLPKGLPESVRLLALELRALERIRRERFTHRMDPRSPAGRLFVVEKHKPGHGPCVATGSCWAAALYHFDQHPSDRRWPPPRDVDDPAPKD